MGRKTSPTLTDAELRVMQVLWDRREATVGEVKDSLAKKIPLAYSTVLTTLRILEQKGYIVHKKKSRAFVYSPLVNLTQARKSALHQLVRKFFQNSPGQLVLNILDSEKLSTDEIQQLKRKIKEGK
jgi:predicted transcriptional regulator